MEHRILTHPMAARERFRKIVELPDRMIDLTEAALVIALEEYPSLQLDRYLDQIDEWGAYLQSETALHDKLDLVLALRYDHSSVLEDPAWSPRAALVIKPAEDQSFRLSYNKAFSTPSTLNMFLLCEAGKRDHLYIGPLFSDRTNSCYAPHSGHHQVH